MLAQHRKRNIFPYRSFKHWIALQAFKWTQMTKTINTGVLALGGKPASDRQHLRAFRGTPSVTQSPDISIVSMFANAVAM